MVLADALPLGTAMDNTGAAEWLASGMIDMLAYAGPAALLSGFIGFNASGYIGNVEQCIRSLACTHRH